MQTPVEILKLPVPVQDSSSEYDTDLEEDVINITEREREQQQLKYAENVGIGHKTYAEMCQTLHAVPIRRISDQLPLISMRLQHVGLNDSQCKALACALWDNACIENLDLDDNGLTSDGLVTILNVLRNKANVLSLSLSENKIDTVGAMTLLDVLKDTVSLVQLNLSGTHLGDKDIEHIAAGLQLNSTVRCLDLSHNNISDEGSKKLGRAIGDTVTLQTLNLSWNHIRLAGAVGILKGLKSNTSLVNVNLNMNGLGFEGSLQMEETLHENTCLKYLDISNNRINWEGISYVAKGLKKNGTLQMLKIGCNPINMEGCYELLKAMTHKKSAMVYVGLDNIPVNGAVLTVANEIMMMRPFSITHGGILDTRDVVGIRKEKPEDPITLVVRYLATVGIRIIDLFRMFDSDNDGQVSKREFIRGLRRVGVPLSDKDLHAVASRLDKNKKGVISYGLLSHGVRSHIREERKEDKRLEVRKRNRLDERRRILQTELPEIYKRNYEDDMSMFYASQSSTTFSSPLRSATGSTASLAGSQVPILPPIEMSRSSFRSRQESVEPKGNELQNGLEPPQALQMSASTRRMSSSQGRMKKSYKLMKFVNAYLDRKKSIANIDMSLLHIPKLET